MEFSNFLEQLTELREMVIYIYQITLYDIIKDKDKQQDKEVHKARSRRVPRAGILSLLVHDAFTNPEALQTPSVRLLWKFHYVGMID